jgi:hypothetical protein
MIAHEAPESVEDRPRIGVVTGQVGDNHHPEALSLRDRDVVSFLVRSSEGNPMAGEAIFTGACLDEVVRFQAIVGRADIVAQFLLGTVIWADGARCVSEVLREGTLRCVVCGEDSWTRLRAIADHQARRDRCRGAKEVATGEQNATNARGL